MDNWVLDFSNDKNELRLFLIDFGKAIDLLGLEQQYDCEVNLIGNPSVNNYSCYEMLTDIPWTYEVIK